MRSSVELKSIAEGTRKQTRWKTSLEKVEPVEIRELDGTSASENA